MPLSCSPLLTCFSVLPFLKNLSCLCCLILASISLILALVYHSLHLPSISILAFPLLIDILAVISCPIILCYLFVQCLRYPLKVSFWKLPIFVKTEYETNVCVSVEYFNYILLATSIHIRVFRTRERERERERETNMATMMSKPDFQNPLQFINDLVVCMGPVRFEYVLCKNYL
jgi:hypothetical protein